MQQTTMPRNTIILGTVLIVVGVVAFVASDAASWTAFIPSILGAILLICGFIGIRSPKIGIHIALVVAILGIGGTAMNVVKLGDLFAGDAERPLAIVASTITFVLLIVYVVLGVRSFIAAKRWKQEASDQSH